MLKPRLVVQACDAVEHVCVYWSCLQDPRLKLKDLLDCKSSLAPTMVTDAKALFDSFHREGFGLSVVDKRVSLEVRVMKERLLALGGALPKDSWPTALLLVVY